MRPIRARKLFPQVGQWWVCVDAVLVVLALRAALFCSAGRVLCSSAVMAPWVTMRRQQGLSEASDSQDSVLIRKSFRETLRLSLKRLRWQPTAFTMTEAMFKRNIWPNSATSEDIYDPKSQ